VSSSGSAVTFAVSCSSIVGLRSFARRCPAAPSRLAASVAESPHAPAKHKVVASLPEPIERAGNGDRDGGLQQPARGALPLIGERPGREEGTAAVAREQIGQARQRRTAQGRLANSSSVLRRTLRRFLLASGHRPRPRSRVSSIVSKGFGSLPDDAGDTSERWACCFVTAPSSSRWLNSVRALAATPLGRIPLDTKWHTGSRRSQQIAAFSDRRRSTPGRRRSGRSEDDLQDCCGRALAR